MSYRIQIELGERVSLIEKVQLHAKLLRHFQRRNLNADARGKTNWKMEFVSERGRFEIIWSREPLSAATGNGPRRFNRERFLGMVVIKFSKDDLDIAGSFIVVGDIASIEEEMLKREKVA